MPKQAAKLRWYFCNEIMTTVREDKQAVIREEGRPLHNSSVFFSAVGLVLSLFSLLISFNYSLAEIINLCVGKHLLYFYVPSLVTQHVAKVIKHYVGTSGSCEVHVKSSF